jgi:hypothetical protein
MNSEDIRLLNSQDDSSARRKMNFLPRPWATKEEIEREVIKLHDAIGYMFQKSLKCLSELRPEQKRKWQKWAQSDKKQPILSRVMFHYEGEAKLDEALFEVEQRPGCHRYVGPLPSHLTHPSFEPEKIWSKEVCELSLNRQNTFIKNLKTYGAKHILNKARLEAYLTESYPSDIPVKLRRAQVQNCIALLNNSDLHFDIRLADISPEQQIFIKGMEAAIFRAQQRHEKNKNLLQWGPCYIQSTDLSEVVRLVGLFEEEWSRLSSKGGQNKNSVKNELLKLLKNTSSK